MTSRLDIGNILLIEDGRGDIRLTEEALKEFKNKIKLNVVMDGEAAMLYLRKQGQYKDQPRPDLILLDLNLPKKDGRQVLKEIKEDPDLKSIPVIVLSISSNQQEINSAYMMHANCYIIKPLDFNQFVDAIKWLEKFWFTVVKLPSVLSDE